MSLSEKERVIWFAEKAPAAQAVMRDTGFLASVTLAQMGLEGGFGQSSLAKKYHNHFGIKGEGDAGSVVLPTWEEVNGERVEIEAKFRAYTSDEAGLKDRTKMLMNAKFGNGEYRYRHLFGVRDYIQVAKGLKRGNYATDSLYAEKLINCIEKYGLQVYDKLPSPAEKPEPIPAKEEPPIMRTEPLPYAVEAIEWAKGNGISDGTRPAAEATREEVISLIYRANKLTGNIIDTHHLMFGELAVALEAIEKRLDDMETRLYNLENKPVPETVKTTSILSLLNPKNWGVKK